MPKDNRNGNRTRRQSRTGRLPQRTSKHIIIVTDGRETEINYINGLKKTITGSGIRITIKQENPPENLVKEVLRLKNLSAASEPEPWVFFDRDDVPKFDDIIREAEENGVNTAWSNPCVEIWFSAHFENIKTYTQSKQCIDEFKDLYYRKTRNPYRKNDEEIYRRLTESGDETKAIERAENLMRKYAENTITKPSEMMPGTTVSKLIKSIREEQS